MNNFNITNRREDRLANIPMSEISPRLYNMIIGGVIVSGFLLNILMAHFFTTQIMAVNFILLLVIYFVGSIGCIILVHKSDDPVVSYLGFLGLSCCMGLLMTYFFRAYSLGTVEMAFLITGIITLLMTMLAGVWPKFFLGLGRVLFISLIGAILIEIIFRLILGFDLAIMDYVVVLIFSGYIGLDWARAQAYPKTLNNAVDCAADLYVDIVNILIRIISILGDR